MIEREQKIKREIERDSEKDKSMDIQSRRDTE